MGLQQRTGVIAQLGADREHRDSLALQRSRHRAGVLQRVSELCDMPTQGGELADLLAQQPDLFIHRRRDLTEVRADQHRDISAGRQPQRSPSRLAQRLASTGQSPARRP